MADEMPPMADDLVVQAALKEQGWLGGGYENMPCVDCKGRLYGAKGCIRCRACAAVAAYLAVVAERDEAKTWTTKYVAELGASEAQCAAITASNKDAIAILDSQEDRIAALQAQLAASEAARGILEQAVRSGSTGFGMTSLDCAVVLAGMGKAGEP